MNAITDSDLVALSLLGIRVTGYQALTITGPLAGKIGDLLAQIPPQARIECENAEALLARCGPTWKLWELQRDVTDRRTSKRLGPGAAGKLLARKRPDLIPISDRYTSKAFSRPVPALNVKWWDAVRSAALDPRRAANGMTLWEYLADCARPRTLPTFRSCACWTSWAGCTAAAGGKKGQSRQTRNCPCGRGSRPPTAAAVRRVRLSPGR